MAQQRFPVVRISTSTTTTIIGSGCFVSQIVIACSAPGVGDWMLRIQSKSSPVNILIPAFTLSVPTDGKPIIIPFDQPVFMPAGVDAVTTGGSAGVVDIWMATKQTDSGT